MDDVRPRKRTAPPAEHLPSRSPLTVDKSKDELLQYFAWGYLNRRELNERLRQLEHQRIPTAA
jgi:hypothetical protein